MQSKPPAPGEENTTRPRKRLSPHSILQKVGDRRRSTLTTSFSLSFLYMNVDCWLDILQLPSFCGFTSLAEFLLLTKIKWLRSMKLFFSCCLSPRPIFYTKNHLFFLFQNDNFFSFISRSIFFSTEERRAPGSWHIDTTSFLLCQKKKTTLKLVAKQQSCPDTVDGSVSYMLWPDWESFLTFFAALSRALALRSSKCNVSQHISSAFIVSSTRKEREKERSNSLRFQIYLQRATERRVKWLNES